MCESSWKRNILTTDVASMGSTYHGVKLFLHLGSGEPPELKRIKVVSTMPDVMNFCSSQAFRMKVLLKWLCMDLSFNLCFLHFTFFSVGVI